MYQLEVKRWLVFHRFAVADGWDVTIDIDSMDRGENGQHPFEKRQTAAKARVSEHKALKQLRTRFMVGHGPKELGNVMVKEILIDIEFFRQKQQFKKHLVKSSAEASSVFCNSVHL